MSGPAFEKTNYRNKTKQKILFYHSASDSSGPEGILFHTRPGENRRDKKTCVCARTCFNSPNVFLFVVSSRLCACVCALQERGCPPSHHHHHHHVLHVLAIQHSNQHSNHEGRSVTGIHEINTQAPLAAGEKKQPKKTLQQDGSTPKMRYRERRGKKSLLVDLTTVTCACSLGNKVNIEQESQCCHQERGDG